MKCCSLRLGLARRLLALSVSLAVVVSSQAFAFASLGKSPQKASGSNAGQADSPTNELRLIAASATATATGILLHWRTNSVANNLGFNVYRLKDGQRTRVNREIIPGAVFAPSGPGRIRSGYSYSWFDRGGTPAATYYIESVSIEGATKIHEAITPVISKTVSGFEQTPETLGAGSTSATQSTDMFEKYYPAEQAQPGSLSGTIQEQWVIAGQPALKIQIKKDGWYRVTQQQMAGAGFNPTVDIRNLRLFVDANEVAISTNQARGQFGSGDYIEFYGRGLDTPTTDARTYYLIAGTTPGKRVRGEIQLDDDPIEPPGPASTPPTSIPPSSNLPTGFLFHDPIFFSWVEQNLRQMLETLRPGNIAKTSATESDAPRSLDVQRGNSKNDKTSSDSPTPDSVQPIGSSTEVKPLPESPDQVTASTKRDHTPIANVATAAASPTTAKTSDAAAAPGRVISRSVAGRNRQSRKSSSSRKKKRGKVRLRPRQERNHAVLAGGFAPANFDYTSERKDRTVYFVTPLNGDAENFFGQVITFNASNPVSQTINTPNPDLTVTGPARLEIALQGVNAVNHQISIDFNGVVIGSFSFFGYNPASGGHPVKVFDIPVSQLHDGANTIKFILPAGGDVSIVDYVKLTYPHSFRADSTTPCSTPNRTADESLRFSLRGTQSVTVDGFCTSSVRLIDYTDPLNVFVAKPDSQPSASGYAIRVPVSEPISKSPRLLYAIPEGRFDQPAALSLNQPSSLNLSSNAADFLIVSYNTFIPSFTANVSPINTSLVAQRQSQNMTVSIVDVEDVYDEFSYGVHGPQALRDFLQHAATQWGTHPRYVILAGDASLDPRNYMNVGNFDFVPTKLVDATFNETASDDWLSDFDNDGIADIPIGRLPMRTVAEAGKLMEKIVNFAPANVPQIALLVADQDDQFHSFGFVEANDAIQQVLQPSMTVQRVNRGTGPSDAQVRADIINGFNDGRAIVNYTGHGNVDVWTGASLFTSADAIALTNQNKLSFVVVMDCLNGYFQDPTLLSLSEALLKAPNGGAVAAFASSGLTVAQGQHVMSEQLFTSLYSGQPMALGDAIKIAKNATFDIDVKRTWIYFGDPSLKIR